MAKKPLRRLAHALKDTLNEVVYFQLSTKMKKKKIESYISHIIDTDY